MEPLKGGAVVTSDWARLRQEPCVDSLSVVASLWDCTGSPPALTANTQTGGAGIHLWSGQGAEAVLG